MDRLDQSNCNLFFAEVFWRENKKGMCCPKCRRSPLAYRGMFSEQTQVLFQ